jgi:non-specific serine/threonine protein kinase/serine/threonine-protein kinase
VVCTVSPEAPSTTLRRLATRGGAADDARTGHAPPDASRNPRLLAGDLDAIVLMALRKEPERRYSSVEQLSADIERYLRGQPVLARRDAFTYRAGKFIRQHRVATVAAVLLLVAALAAVGTIVWQARQTEVERARAERRFNEVRALANSLLFELHDAIAALPGSTPPRQLLIRRALQYLERLAEEGIPDAAFRQEIAAAYRRVGDVQGNPYTANIGDVPGAAASYRRSLDILAAAGGAERGSRAYRAAVAEGHERLGDMLVISGDVSGGLASQRRSLELRVALAATGAGDAKTRIDVARSHSKVGQALYWQGDAVGALDQHRQAVKTLEPFVGDVPGDLEVELPLISSLVHLGDVLLATSAPSEALETLHRAESLALRWTPRDPSNTRLLRQLAICYTKLGETLEALQDRGGAVASHRRALAVRDSIATADVGNVQARRDVAISHVMVASALARADQHADVNRHLETGLAIFEELARSSGGSVLGQADLVFAYNIAGATWLRASVPSRALGSFERAIAVARAVVATDQGDADTRHELASAYANAGDAHQALAQGRAPARARERSQLATASYERAHRELQELRARGALRDSGTALLAAVEEKLARSPRALRQQTIQRAGS